MGTAATALVSIIGLAYSLWHTNADWLHPHNPPMLPWGTPLHGFYASDDQVAIVRHAKELHAAGVDFIYMDWSNDIDTPSESYPEKRANWFIEAASHKLAETYAELSEHPQISIMLGVGNEADAYTNGKLQKKADQVYRDYASDPKLASIYQSLYGKPLLLIFDGVPDPAREGRRPWDDTRFTVRYMGGFLTEQPALLGPNQESKFGYWSWEDRGPPTFAMHDGKVEAMTVVAAWRPLGNGASPGRRGGQTYLDGWSRARALKPTVVLAGTFNEWWRSEQPSPEVSKDVEPSVEFGTSDLDIIREQGALLKRGR